MCGIGGIFRANGGPVDPSSVKRMCDVIAHRGPDDEGYYFSPAEPGIGLGHRRLAILDLSETGRQPMPDESGRLWLSFNGEIYNHPEIRETLAARGHRFRSRTDTEVILHAYEEWGIECAARFNGMWAFALWDGVRDRLFLSRDRFGVKPLYYLAREDGFVFGSEIKAILAIRPEERVPNLPYLAAFLAYGMMDHGEETCFRNIRSLPPGHSMVVTADGLKTVRYWDLGQEAAAGVDGTAGPGRRGLEERFLHLLKDAVRLRLASDVAVGACLSGGLDSSAIVSLASSCVQGLPTFTSVFEDPCCDESRFAAQVEERYRTRPHHVRPDAQGFIEALSRMIWFQDEPGAAYGIFPQWKVMEEASHHVRVILDGQGGDELLAGYHHFLPHYLLTLRDDPSVERGDFVKTRDLLKRLYGPQLASPFLRGSDDPEYRKAAIAPDLRTQVPAGSRDFAGPFAHHLDNVLYKALTRDILPGLLHYQDRMSMAFSLESRVPFLDYRLVRFCFTLPYGSKIRQGMTKAILRDAVAGIVPETIRSRKDKMGFPAPLSGWIRGELRPLVHDLLLSDRPAGRGVLDPVTVKKRLEDHMNASCDHTWEIWRWLSLEVWFREFIDGPAGGTRR
jgi:asparagine synthase (glutamine-hydrolysing)